ncbi:MAG: IclR family transcriptional regulator [Burkholderiaceae bacterium]
MSDYTNEGQQRILRLVKLLAGNEITGLAPADIARQQGCSASMVTRDLDNLRSAGWAERVPETDRWRLAPEVVQIATRHMAALDRAEQRLGETRNRYSRA